MKRKTRRRRADLRKEEKMKRERRRDTRGERGLGFCMKREREREIELKTMIEKGERMAKRNRKRRKKG